MSDGTESVRGADVFGGDRPTRSRAVLLVVLGAFWLWLLARWLVEWTGVPVGVPGEPFVDVALVGGPQTPLGVMVGSLPALAVGVYVTVVLTVVSIALGFVLAVPLSVARVYGAVSSYVSLSFTELIRGTPLIAQLFVLYYGLNLSQYFRGLTSFAGVTVDPALWVAVIGFTINSAAYQAEYIRAAIESVDPRQLVAARSVGLDQLDGIRYVVLPQGLRYAIPGWTNELVYLIKYSSLATFITVTELFTAANDVASETFRYTAMFTVVALFYLLLVLTATTIMSTVEDRVAIPGIGGAEGRP
jgi:polar amino acid transport system permease protein